MPIPSFIRRISYSGLVPRPVLRLADELLLFPAMWFPSPLARKCFNRLRGARIGSGGWIGQGALLGNHPFLLTVGNNVIISAGVKLLTHDTSFTVVGGKDLAGKIIIGDNVQIGENAVLLPGVEIGANCVIGAGAVVTGDIPSGSVAVGVPARVVSSIAEALLKLDEKLKGEKYFSTWKRTGQISARPEVPDLKICILSNKNHIYSNYLIKRLAETFPSVEFIIIESSLLLGGMTRAKALLKYFKVSGIHYTASQILKNLYFTFLGFVFGALRIAAGRRYFPYKFLRYKNIKTIRPTLSVNSPDFVAWLREGARPDLILSLYFNQILKKDILDIPRLGAFNLHPALLPKYRGISPTFWALAKGERKTGVTLHKISLKIDEGDIISQKEIDILSNDSEHTLYERCNEAGLGLVVDFINNFKQGIQPEYKAMNLSEGSYFPIPTRQAMRDFANNKRKLWSIFDLFKKYE